MGLEVIVVCPCDLNLDFEAVILEILFYLIDAAFQDFISFVDKHDVVAEFFYRRHVMCGEDYRCAIVA